MNVLLLTLIDFFLSIKVNNSHQNFSHFLARYPKVSVKERRKNSLDAQKVYLRALCHLQQDFRVLKHFNYEHCTISLHK